MKELGSLAIELLTFVFLAGGFYVWVRMTIKDLRGDMNGMGRKINETNATAARRHQNISLVLMLVAPTAKESEISNLLKESN
jgi:hypothetical protein